MMVGCTVCDNIVIVLDDLTDEEIEHYVCPNCRGTSDNQEEN